ncbi:MAG: hypothetical protein D6785_09015, partial [Planctomycetota bacterium]
LYLTLFSLNEIRLMAHRKEDSFFHYLFAGGRNKRWYNALKEISMYLPKTPDFEGVQVFSLNLPYDLYFFCAKRGDIVDFRKDFAYCVPSLNRFSLPLQTIFPGELSAIRFLWEGKENGKMGLNLKNRYFISTSWNKSKGKIWLYQKPPASIPHDFFKGLPQLSFSFPKDGSYYLELILKENKMICQVGTYSAPFPPTKEVLLKMNFWKYPSLTPITPKKEILLSSSDSAISLSRESKMDLYLGGETGLVWIQFRVRVNKNDFVSSLQQSLKALSKYFPD